MTMKMEVNIYIEYTGCSIDNESFVLKSTMAMHFYCQKNKMCVKNYILGCVYITISYLYCRSTIAWFNRTTKVSISIAFAYFSKFSILKLGLFVMMKLALALQFIVTNAYFSVARMLTLVLHATLK